MNSDLKKRLMLDQRTVRLTDCLAIFRLTITTPPLISSRYFGHLNLHLSIFPVTKI